ncbi:MAG TPA: hypothetical protein VFV74_06165 [Burkholderiales bacterium]|nr:hypothetical protein [Burkholderiales bacterium]
MRRLAALLLVLSLAACATDKPWIRFEPPSQDPGVRAGTHEGSTMLGPGVQLKTD